MINITIERSGDGSQTVSLKSQNKDDFTYAIELLKNCVPPHARSYEPSRRVWCIAAEAAADLKAWIFYLSRECQVYVSDRSASAGGEASKKEMEPSAAYAALHLLPSAPPELIRVAFKVLATIHHPDKLTGNAEEMRKLNAAYETLQQRLQAA